MEKKQKMIRQIINEINHILQTAWISKYHILHGLSDCAYNVACFFYKIANFPSRKCLERILSGWKGAKLDKSKSLVRTMQTDWLKYGVKPEDYLLFDFSHLKNKQKKEYITNVNVAKYSSILNDRSFTPIFEHKYTFYQKFKKYYKRAVIKSRNIDEQFIATNPVFFFKPESLSQGQGAQIIHADQYSGIQQLKAAVPGWDCGICEGLVKQDDWMAAFNPDSVNTLRIKTITQLNGSITIFAAIFRAGRKNSVTDNAATNGLMANVDTNSGMIVTDGYDKYGNRYANHPDSGTRIKGSVIPKYMDAVNMAKEMATVFPTVRYISWDMALTDSGWVLIEANTQGCFEHQVTLGHGCKSSFVRLIKI